MDTNIIVSAYLNQDGHPFRILKLALAGHVHLCASEPILAEYQELLERKRFPLQATTIFKPAGKLTATPDDPDDNIFLECAQAAKAQYLITGNTKHFPSRWKYPKRVTPAAFLVIWQAEHSSP